MTAWIMVDSSGMPTTRNMYDLHQGFKELGEDVKTYNAADVFADTIPHTENDIVVGHIQQCRAYVKHLTGKDVPNLDYPEELMPFMKRKFQLVPLSSVHGRFTIDENPEPLFVKSYDQKVITGFVCKSFEDYARNCVGHDKDLLVYTSEVMDFRAEFRTYIHRHEIVTSLRYKGAWDLAPRRSTLEDMVYALRNANMPIAYSIDVGILECGKTVLIECNDGFALGNYGVPARKYAEMHRDRWYQMVRS